MQNGYVESFNGKMRDELLNETLFFSLDQARKVIAAWIEDYNTARPHSALAYQTPAAFAAKLTATGLHAALLTAPRSGLLLNPPNRAYNSRGSKSCWMKLQWQVSLFEGSLDTFDLHNVTTQAPYFIFNAKDYQDRQGYSDGFKITELIALNNSGVKTDRDELFVDFDRHTLVDRIKILLSGRIPDDFARLFRVQNSSSYKIKSKLIGKKYSEAIF